MKKGEINSIEEKGGKGETGWREEIMNSIHRMAGNVPEHHTDTDDPVITRTLSLEFCNACHGAAVCQAAGPVPSTRSAGLGSVALDGRAF